MKHGVLYNYVDAMKNISFKMTNTRLKSEEFPTTLHLLL